MRPLPRISHRQVKSSTVPGWVFPNSSSNKSDIIFIISTQLEASVMAYLLPNLMMAPSSSCSLMRSSGTSLKGTPTRKMRSAHHSRTAMLICYDVHYEIELMIEKHKGKQKEVGKECHLPTSSHDMSRNCPDSQGLTFNPSDTNQVSIH